MATDGISRLIVVTQLKSQNANEAALNGADKQRSLINDQKALRAQQTALNDKLSDKTITWKADGTGEAYEIQAMLQRAGLSTAGIDASGTQGLTGGTVNTDRNSKNYGMTEYKLGAEGAQADNQAFMDKLSARFEAKMKDLESADKLGNFDIQDLMATYNQAETLASSVLKKRDDTGNSIIGKV